jgi:carbon-monoxide dehydrogenase medium subunit
MYPAAFDYVAPTTADEALAALAEHGDDARVLAGGQSLIPMMKLRFAYPAMLVDINRVPGLDTLAVEDGHVRVGALVRHNDVVDSEVVPDANKTMAAAAPWISDPIIRNLGTVGGSVAHADPLGDWASVMLACNATVVALSAKGERTIPMTEFITGPFTTALETGEMLTELRVPVQGESAGGAYLKLERKVGDYATCGVAIHVALDTKGAISEAGIGLTSVASNNIKATAAEAALVGQAPSEELFAEAGELAAQASDPKTDVRGSADFKRDVVRVFTRRGLAQAVAQAQG